MIAKQSRVCYVETLGEREKEKRMKEKDRESAHNQAAGLTMYEV